MWNKIGDISGSKCVYFDNLFLDCDEAEITTVHCAAPVEFNLHLTYFQNVTTV